MRLRCCYGCTERDFSCHAFCERYKKEHFVRNIMKAYSRKEKEADEMIAIRQRTRKAAEAMKKKGR